MKQNIFAQFVPKAIDLPFVSIKFIPEPVQSDVTTLADLPILTLPMVDNRTALVHDFYLQVTRKDVNHEDFNTQRAIDLLQEEVMTSIRTFGETISQGDDSKVMDFDVHYSHISYQHSGDDHRLVLRPDAYLRYFNELQSYALPMNRRYTVFNQIFSLNRTSDGVNFQLQLTDTLSVNVSTTDSSNMGLRGKDDLNYIFGTCKLFGRPAFIHIGPTAHPILDRLDRPIRKWASDKVVLNTFGTVLTRVLDETFGMSSDDWRKKLIEDVEFHHPA